MRLPWWKIAATIVTLLHLNAALACSCVRRDPAGFVHGELKRLPSNARGMLFMPPPAAPSIAWYDKNTVIYGAAPEPVDASWFQITSDAQPGAIKGQLSWPDLSRGRTPASAAKAYRFLRDADQAAFMALPHDQRPPLHTLLDSGQLTDISDAVRLAARLVRIGPAGGFKPGAHYTIRYLRKLESGREVQPVDFSIDAIPLDAAALRYQLLAEGAPQRLLRPFRAGASCADNQPVLTQAVHYVLPQEVAPYQGALAYFSESRPASGDDHDYTSLDYSPSLCSVRPIGTTTLGGNREQLYAGCAKPAPPLTLRGWVGLLEVEDRLHATPAIAVDLARAPGAACSGLGLLKEALADGDRARIRDTACRLDTEGGPSGPFRGGKYLPTDFPAAQDLVSFALSGDQADWQCATSALVVLANAARREQSSAITRQLGALLLQGLESPDQASVDYSLEQLGHPLWRMDPARTRELLQPLLPALVEIYVTGQSAKLGTAAWMITRMQEQARPYTTALLAVAERSPDDTRRLIPTLVASAPDDARVHALLLRSASQAALLETAALAYARAADAAHRPDAVRLLMQAVSNGSYSAIDALGEMGAQARSAVPLLITQLRAAPQAYTRSRAYSALLAVSGGEPDAVEALAKAIRMPGGDHYPLADLRKMGPQVQLLLPAIEQRMQQPLSASDRDHLQAAVRLMQLPAAQQQELLQKLDACVLI